MLQRERAAVYLDHGTLRPLLVIVDSKLISAHAAEAVERSFAALLAQARAEDLRRMYSLLHRVNRCVPPPIFSEVPTLYASATSPRIEDMRRAFADSCKRSALALVGSNGAADAEERDKGLVQGLLDFKETMETCVEDGALSRGLVSRYPTLHRHRLISGAFSGNETFTAALRGALESAINSRENKPAELIGAIKERGAWQPRAHYCAVSPSRSQVH